MERARREGRNNAEEGETERGIDLGNQGQRQRQRQIGVEMIYRRKRQGGEGETGPER